MTDQQPEPTPVPSGPPMAEVLAEALRAQGITDEPEKFDGDIHGWRCSYPDIYGRCDCFAETVRDVAQALTDAGYGHVAIVEAERDEWRRTAAAQTRMERERAEAAEARVAELERAVDAVRRRHPRGDEDGGVLAPGLWCPGCGCERADGGRGACPDRAALDGEATNR